MTLTELLNKIRDQYLQRFQEVINENEANGYQVISEPELYNSSGVLSTSGFFNTSYRYDITVINNGIVINSILVDTKKKLSFNPIAIEWADDMIVTINSFQWNFMTLEFEIIKIDDWSALINWFNKSFKEKQSNDQFKKVVHYISDPYIDENKNKIDIDLGSGTIDDFENLLDALNKLGLKKIKIK